jgi:hypothetical protein
VSDVVKILVERRVKKDPSAFRNPRIKNPATLHPFNYVTVDTLEVTQKLFDGVCREEPEALGELATELKSRGLSGQVWLKFSRGDCKLKLIGCELNI